MQFIHILIQIILCEISYHMKSQRMIASIRSSTTDTSSGCEVFPDKNSTIFSLLQWLIYRNIGYEQLQAQITMRNANAIWTSPFTLHHFLRLITTKRNWQNFMCDILSQHGKENNKKIKLMLTAGRETSCDYCVNITSHRKPVSRFVVS